MMLILSNLSFGNNKSIMFKLHIFVVASISNIIKLRQTTKCRMSNERKISFLFLSVFLCPISSTHGSKKFDLHPCNSNLTQTNFPSNAFATKSKIEYMTVKRITHFRLGTLAISACTRVGWGLSHFTPPPT